MVSRGAEEHARRFVDKIKQAKEQDLKDAERLVLDATEAFILPAVESAGPARDVLADVVGWVDRPFREDDLRGLEDGISRHAERLPNLDEANGLVLAPGYLRAAQELADPQKGPRIREALRSPGQHREAIRRQLGAIEGDFRSALLQETVRASDTDPGYKGKINRGFAELRRMERRLREIGTSGEGKERNPWEVGVAFACSLALPWCVVAAVVVIVVVVVVVVATK